jgi:hypothetical protein
MEVNQPNIVALANGSIQLLLMEKERDNNWMS